MKSYSTPGVERLSVYGPVLTMFVFSHVFAHGSFAVACALTAFSLMMPVAQIDISSYVNGLNFVKWKTTVFASGVVIWFGLVIVSIFITDGKYDSGSLRPRRNENLTSALVNGEPSANLTPCRRWNVSVVRDLLSVQLWASWPTYWPVTPFVVCGYWPLTGLRPSSVPTMLARTSLSPSVPNCWKSMMLGSE